MQYLASGVFGLATLSVASTAVAAAADDNDNAHITGILIGTYQAASESKVDGQNVHGEGNAQLYMMGTLDMGPGTWHLEVRGGTTPRHNGVTKFYSGVNDSVGETLDSNGKGRIAATQFFYELPLGPGKLSVGLLDSTGYLDANSIADNEYTQFLGTSFVNNPSIDYPSFSLGAGYQGDLSQHWGYKLFVSSSSGLEAASDPTYSNVVNVGENGKGVFSAGELEWQTGAFNGDIGVWYNRSDHARLNRPSEANNANYGFYTSGGGPVGPGRVQAWAGIADDSVMTNANFLALAYAVSINNTTLGAGIARRGVSNDYAFADGSPTDSIYQAELYWRFHVVGNTYITPDIQYVDNSGFRGDRDGVIVGGLRAGVGF